MFKPLDVNVPPLSPLNVNVDPKVSISASRWGDPKVKFKYLPLKVQMAEYLSLIQSKPLSEETVADTIFKKAISKVFQSEQQVNDYVSLLFGSNVYEENNTLEKMRVEILKGLIVEASSASVISFDVGSHLSVDATAITEISKALQKRLIEQAAAYDSLEKHFDKALSSGASSNETISFLRLQYLTQQVINQERFSIQALKSLIEESNSISVLSYHLEIALSDQITTEEFLTSIKNMPLSDGPAGLNESIAISAVKILSSILSQEEAVSFTYLKNLIDSFVSNEVVTLNVGKNIITTSSSTEFVHLAKMRQMPTGQVTVDFERKFAVFKPLNESAFAGNIFEITSNDYFAEDYNSGVYAGTQLTRQTNV